MLSERTAEPGNDRTIAIEQQLPEAWNAEVSRAVRTPWMLEALVAQDGAAPARFAHYYTELRRLPRQLRRAAWGRRSLGLAGFAFVLALAGPQATWGGTTISVSTGEELAEAITLANSQIGNYAGENTIGVQAALAIESALDAVTSSIVIEGNSYSIVGSALLDTSIFTVQGIENSLTLNEATVTGGSGDKGGAVDNGGRLKLMDSTLSGNTVTDKGGAIFNNGLVYMYDSVLSDNSAQDRGGAIYNKGRVTIHGGELSGNSAQNGGGIANQDSVVLQNSDISGNVASNNGGAAFNEAGTFTISNSNISGNNALRGGGIDVPNGHLDISYSMLSENSAAEDGGAIRSEEGASVKLDHSTVSGNSAQTHGGGIRAYRESNVHIKYSTVSGNSAQSGGGLYLHAGSDYNNGGTAEILYSTFSGNVATNGGAIHVARRTSLTVENTTLSGNSATSDGGGIKAADEGPADRSTISVTNSTLTGNSAAGKGGGIYTDPHSDLTLASTIVSGNHASDDDNIRTSGSNSSIQLNNNNLFGYGGNSGVGGSASAGSTDIVPSVPLAYILDPTLKDNGGPTYTHALVGGSPAIDAASTSCPPPDLDQRGYGRPAGSASVCDIGAFEYGAADATAPTIEVGGKIKNLGTDRGKYKLKAAFALEHELDLSEAVVRIETLAAEGPNGEALISLEDPVEVTGKPGGKANKGVFKFDHPDFGKGKLELKLKEDVLEAKLKLKRLELAEPTGCGEDGETPVASRFIVRSGVNPSVVIEPDASWECKFRRDGTVRKLKR